MTSSEIVARLNEIRNEMNALLKESLMLVRKADNTLEYERARAYWYGHIKMALNNDHEFVGESGHTLEQAITALDPLEDEDENSDD